MRSEDNDRRCVRGCPVESLARHAEAMAEEFDRVAVQTADAARALKAAAVAIRAAHMATGAGIEDLREALEPSLLKCLEDEAAARRRRPGWKPTEEFAVSVARRRTAVREACRMLFTPGEE